MSGLALLGVSTSDSSSSGDDEVCEVSACVREVVKRRRAAIMVWQRKRPRVRMKPRRSRCAFDWDAHVQQLTPHEFRKLYRMEHTAFIKMVDAVTPNLKPIDSKLAFLARAAGPVSPCVTMACTMWFLGGGQICDIRIVGLVHRLHLLADFRDLLEHGIPRCRLCRGRLMLYLVFLSASQTGLLYPRDPSIYKQRYLVLRSRCMCIR